MYIEISLKIEIDKYYSFESTNYPGYYLRHRNGEIWIDKADLN